jgi:hypothetical protein
MSKQAMRALERCQRLFKEALPKFNWGAAFLDSNDIQLLNDVPAEVDAAITALKQQGEPVALVSYSAFKGYVCSWIPGSKVKAGDSLYTSAPTIPEGMVLVPKEPTDAMQAAGCEVDCPQDGAPTPYSVWQAMLSAAPKGEQP